MIRVSGGAGGGSGISKATADATYGALAGGNTWTGTQDFTGATVSGVSASGGSVVFSQPGSASASSSGTWRAPANGTVARLNLSCLTAPIGSALSVDVKKNGTTIQTLTIADGSTSAAGATPATAFVAGDLFSVTTTSVGSTTAATGVVVQLDY